MEKVLLTLTVVAFLVIVAITAYSWPALPARMPTHYGVDGKPHAFFIKNGFLVLPSALLALAVFFTVKLRYPWTFQYSVEITPENAARHYQRARLRLTTSFLSLATGITIGQWQTIQFWLGGGVAQFLRSIDPTILFAADLLIPFAAFVLIVRLSERGGAADR